MFKLPQKVINDIPKFKENLEKFLKGELKDTFFRGIRVPWGFYSQRGGKILMSRLRIPAGILIPHQLKAIGEAAKNFADGKLHITTRQDIQIHNVPYQNSIKIIEYLKDFNIPPRGGGGNTVRNITGCYLSGSCPKEKIEVYKIVCGLSEYLLSLDESYNLPRKFKISFSGCEDDCALTGVNDVGFIATDGGFKLIVGGGMGAKSAVGKVLVDSIKPEEIGYVVKAVMNVFNKYGNRKNRHHNRLRFLIQDIGWEKFVELYNQELNKVKESEYIVLKLENNLFHPCSQERGLPELTEPEIKSFSSSKEKYDKDYELFLKYNVVKQKQEKYNCIQLRIPLGEIDSDALIGLSELGDFLPEIFFRTTNRQNLVISNVVDDKVYFVYKKVKSLLKDYLFPNTTLDIVSCKAATTCNLGICNAMGLAREIVNEFTKINLDIDKLKGVKININGCPNACGQHPIGTVSLSGMARKVYNRTVPFYKVYLGGKIDAENTKLAQEIGIVPARTVPALITDFISGIQNNSEKDIRSFMSDLIKKYSFVPHYEEDRSYYIDYGRTEEFSLDGLSQGECGAGVIDMIESDLESANQSLIKAKEKNYDINETKNGLIYSARALLVVRGVDAKDEQETISAFIDKLVKSGICKQEFQTISDVYKDIISGNILNKEAVHAFVERFYKEVKEIYSLMDSNFNFPIRFRAGPAELPTQNYEPGTTYDLRGTPCPVNYVKAKLKLEELKKGDILEIYLDDGEPIHNVPKSLQDDGQEILEIEQIQSAQGGFRVVVRKKI